MSTAYEPEQELSEISHGQTIVEIPTDDGSVLWKAGCTHVRLTAKNGAVVCIKGATLDVDDAGNVVRITFKRDEATGQAGRPD